MDILIVGAAGHQGSEYLKILEGNYLIKGLVDTNYDALQNTYKDKGIALFHTLEEALGSTSFDAALICIPHAYHFSATTTLLQAGKFIIKEKPLALSLDEVSEYKKLGKNKIFTIVQRQFHEMFFYISSQLHRLGKIYDFHYQYHLNVSEQTSGWRNLFSHSGGGVIIDMGYHIFDVILRLFGKPEKTFGALSYCYDYSGQSYLEDAASITFKYPNNQMHGVVHLNRHASKKREYFEIIGSNGILIMHDSHVQIKNRKGEVLEENEIRDSENKLKMFDFFFKNSNYDHFLSQHFSHHANIVYLIEGLYDKIR